MRPEYSRRSEMAGSGPNGEQTLGDRLPPHLIEAEQGVLGCIFADPKVCLPKVLARCAPIGDSPEEERLFFDGKHDEILRAMKLLHMEGVAIDPLTVFSKVKDLGRMPTEDLMPYLAALWGGKELLDDYLGIVWEKFLARRAVEMMTRGAAGIMEANGLDEPGLARVERRFQEFQALADRNFGMSPQVLKRAEAFMEGAWNRWFGKVEECPGWKMPFAFPLGFRKGEMSVVSGDNGSGKTSLLSHIAVDVAKQLEAEGSEERVCVASFEMSPDVSLWIAQRQLLGRGRLPNNDEGQSLFASSLAWLNKWFWFHDFVGIGSWRDVLDVFAYARDHEHCRFFELDSIMRVGIPEDDLTQQSLASAAMATFAMEKGKESHLMIVGHENKAGEGAKNRVQGSKRWTDNAHLFCQVQRNQKKGEAVAEAEELLRGSESDHAEGMKAMEKWRGVWDTRFLLHKQRYPGARQNGSAHLFFDGGREGSLQFRKKLEEEATFYL